MIREGQERGSRTYIVGGGYGVGGFVYCEDPARLDILDAFLPGLPEQCPERNREIVIALYLVGNYDSMPSDRSTCLVDVRCKSMRCGRQCRIPSFDHPLVWRSIRRSIECSSSRKIPIMYRSCRGSLLVSLVRGPRTPVSKHLLRRADRALRTALFDPSRTSQTSDTPRLVLRAIELTPRRHTTAAWEDAHLRCGCMNVGCRSIANPSLSKLLSLLSSAFLLHQGLDFPGKKSVRLSPS